MSTKTLGPKLFSCTDHDGHYPVGTASIVIAKDEIEARRFLDAELMANGLKPHAEEPYTLKELPLIPGAVVLNNGDY